MFEGVLLVAHGSPDPRSAAAVRAIAERVEYPVSFLEFDDPHPFDALCRLAKEGASRVRAQPLLLTDAYHAQVDLPGVARRVMRRHPELTVEVGRPLGDLVLAKSLVRGVPEVDGLAVCAAGTKVDQGRAHVEGVAAEAGRLLGVPAGAGFASGPGPRPAAVVDGLRAGGAKRIGVVCYFIAPGKLCDAAVASAQSAGVQYVGEPIGMAPELLGLILDDDFS